MASKEVELAKINATREKAAATFSVIGVLIRVTGGVLAIKFIMDGLERIVLSKPESIEALAKVVEAINTENILSYFLVVGTGIAWKLERNGKKRAIKKIADMRKKYEPNEPSSGLTETGDSPEEG